MTESKLTSILRGTTVDMHSYRVEQLDPSRDRDRLEALAAAGSIREVYDLLRQQVGELFDTRHPVRKLSPDEKIAAYSKWLREHHDGDEDAGGVWVYYPWSGRLIRCLSEPEFFELRTSRNRNKITDEEQAVLASKVIGVVGLSVGHASALTLAQEGVGGYFRLADFDTLDMSNLNRLKTFLHSVGLNKSILTARELLELNPYLQVEVITEGITEENIDSFFDGDTTRPEIDLIVEECDSLAMKIRLREEARRRGTPLLMETSDRGLIDVERYDLEPDRPLLHGLAEGLDPSELVSMPDRDKVPYVLRMLGGHSISERFAASLVDVETTIKTWPQLASAVALGGSLVTDTARRIFLDEFRASGRFYVDYAQLITEDTATAIDPDMMDSIQIAEATTQTPTIAPPKPDQADLARWLAEHGVQAPSGGNCQPWRFDHVGDELVCEHDYERSKSFLDYQCNAAYLALGAAAENIIFAGQDLGLDLRARFHRPGTDRKAAPAHFAVTLPQSAPLAVPGARSRLIRARVTNRQLSERVALDTEERDALTQVVAGRGGRLQLLEDDRDLEEIEDILGEAERQRMLSEVMHRELFDELRFTPDETLATMDGIDIATLEITLADLAGMKLLKNFKYLRRMRQMATGHGLSKTFKKAIRCASAIGLVTTAGRAPESYFAGGRAVEAGWLEATRLDLAFQPLTSSLYVINRLVDGDGDGLDRQQRHVFASLRERMNKLFELQPNRAEIMIFRLAKAPPVSARALRLPLDRLAVGQLATYMRSRGMSPV